MARITVEDRNLDIFGPHLNEVCNSVLFRNWVKSFDPSIYLKSVFIQSVDFVGKRILFIKLKSEVLDGQGRPVPGIVFLRGLSVAILPIIKTEIGEFVVLVSACFVALGGSYNYQLPAGMADDEEDLFVVATRELQEETCINPELGRFTNLTFMYFGDSRKFLPSPGGCDERIHIFLYTQQMSYRELQRIIGKEGGLRGENEHLTVGAFPIDKVGRLTGDMKLHTALSIYQTLKEEGGIQ